MKNHYLDEFFEFIHENKGKLLVYGLSIIGIFILEMLFILPFTAYYVTFTKIFSAISVGSIVATTIIFSGKIVSVTMTAIFLTFMIVYSFSIFGILKTFDRLPMMSDVVNVGVLFNKYAAWVVIFGTIFYLSSMAFISYVIFKKTKKYFKKTDWTPFALMLVYYTVLSLANKPNTLDQNRVWHSYSSFVQANRNIYGRYTLAEWGLFNTAMMDDSRWKPEVTNEYISMSESESSMNGLFKDKNVNIVITESFDYVNMNSLATPNLLNAYQNSIRFNNYYVPENHNASCRAETTILSGKYSPGALDCPWYDEDFSSKILEESIFDLYKHQGYDTAYYHSSGGKTYLRQYRIPQETSIDKYVFEGGLGGSMTSNYRDHEFVDRIDTLNKTNKQMNYWFTYDGHAEYHTDVSEKPQLYHDLMSHHEGNEALAKHGIRLSYMDEGIGKLLAKAGADDVFIFITDHTLYTNRSDVKSAYNGSMEDSGTHGRDLYREDDEFFKTPFFIYHNGTPQQDIDTMIIPINVKTIISDLFDLNASQLMGKNPLRGDMNGITFPSGNFYVNGKLEPKATLNYQTRHNWEAFAEERIKYDYLEWI